MKGIWIPIELINIDISWTKRILLAEISQLEMLDKGCVASNTHFAEKLKLSNQAVSKALNELARDELIVISNAQSKRNFGRKITINFSKSAINFSKSAINQSLESKGIEQENIKENKPTRKKSYFNLSKQKSFDELSDEYIEKLKEKIEKHNEDLLIRRLNANSPLNDLYSFEEFETRFLSNGLKKKDWWMTFLQYEKYIFENERKRKGI